MAHSVSGARLEFLKSSARTLFADSPSTSAHLLASHNGLLIDQCKPPTASQEREFCPACGCLRASGWTSSASTAPQKRKNNRSASTSREQSSTSSRTGVAYKCLRCERDVVQSFPKSNRKISSQAKKISSSPTAPQIPPAPSPQASLTRGRVTKVSENASSKKRAKARKNQGLLATLAAGKQQPQPPKPSSSSLDLLDLLQQPK